MNRKGVGLDINPVALETTRARVQEMEEHALGDTRISLKKELQPIVIEGDSRKLEENLNSVGILEGTIKLICAHPPYLDSLKYTSNIEGDLSHLSNPVEFCDELQSISKQIFSLLEAKGICAVLIGDVRKNKHVIPLGFLTMERFLKEGFRLKEIIIKAQHRDSSTRFWFTKRDKIDFLINHEYLLILEKP
jgi:hypothetical protein